MLENGSMQLHVAHDLSGRRESIGYEKSDLPCVC